MFRLLRKTIKLNKKKVKNSQKAQFYERIFLLKRYYKNILENKENFD